MKLVPFFFLRNNQDFKFSATLALVPTVSSLALMGLCGIWQRREEGVADRHVNFDIFHEINSINHHYA